MKKTLIALCLTILCLGFSTESYGATTADQLKQWADEAAQIKSQIATYQAQKTKTTDPYEIKKIDALISKESVRATKLELMSKNQCNATCQASLDKAIKSADYKLQQINAQLVQQQMMKIADKGINLKAYGIVQTTQVDIEGLAGNIIKFLARMIGISGVISIMIGGGMMIVSTGDDSLQGTGKKLILYSIISITIVLGSYVIVVTVQQVLLKLGTY